MAYDRYDDRDDRGHRDDRQRGYRSSDAYQERGQERGFFDRAIDSVSSFFSDDDSGQRRDQGRGYNRAANAYDPGASDRGEGYSRSGYEPRAYDQDEGRQRGGREDDRFGKSDRGAFFGGGQSTSFGRGRDEGDYRNQYGRGGGESGGFGRGDYGRQGQDYYSRQGQDYGDLGSGRSYPSSYGQSGGGSYRETRHQSFGGQQGRGGDRQQGGTQSQGGDRYRPLTGDYGRGSSGQGGQGSGLGGQDFSQQQYSRQDRFQDQGSDQHRSASYYDQTDRGHSAFDTSQQGARGPHDQHYSSWRQRQIEELDRDYDEYCREHQSRFENEFSGFRQQRQTKRQLLGQIREHAEVVDLDGVHIGTVDKVRGEKVILTKNDPEAGGVHRSFTATLLDRIEDGKVYLSGSKDSIRSRLTEERSDDHGSDGGSRGGMLGSLLGGSDNDRRETQVSTNQPSGTGDTGDGPHVLDQSFAGTYEDSGSSTSSRSTKK